jgi:pimeloyl-ACP methyl ester carboxylesterase
MSGNDVSVVLAHGAWADGSSWSKVMVRLQARGVTTIAAPLPLTSFSDDLAALDRASERVDGQLVLVGHAYAGAVWADRPSWFLIAEQDRMIAPETQRFMADRMKARVRSHPVDHAPLVTAPAVVVDLILEAVDDKG